MGDEAAVGNLISGAVNGAVVQAGSIQQVILHPSVPQQRTVPRQLPPALRDFAGRAAAVDELDALLSTGEQDGVAPVVVMIEGAAGTGKTSLAVWWAHRVRDRFPDGCLFASLRGYGPSAPLTPEWVLARFLTALDVPTDRIPADLDAQVGLYRSILAQRRALIVLDNAGSAEQVRPLLPGVGGCGVVVTSRAALTGLAIAEAAHTLTLDVFTPSEARDLVRSVIGHDRVAAEPGAVEELIELCARLPLAVRIAATRLAGRRQARVADIVEDITQDQDRLDTLSSTGDERSAIRTVFDWSYTGLRPELARVFRRLGVHPGTEVGVAAAAVLTGVGTRTVSRQLEALADLHLVEVVGRRRYRLHDLLHAYAAHRAELDEDPDERRAVLTRVVTWYARTAQAADTVVSPGMPRLEIELDCDDECLLLADRPQAMAWLNTELPNLVAALRAALDHEWFTAAVVLAGSVRFLAFRERAMWPIRLEAESWGVVAARAGGDRVAEAFLLGVQGETLSDLGRWEEAVATFRDQLAVGQELDDLVRQRSALTGLGLVRLRQGRYREARTYYLRALPIARQFGGRGEAIVECNLSVISARLGDYDQARQHAERELVLRREAGDRVGEAFALHSAAVAWLGLGDAHTGLRLAQRAVVINRSLDGTERYLAPVLGTAAECLERIGELARAVESLREAATILARLDDPEAEQVHGRLRALEGRLAPSEPGRDDQP